MGSSSLWSSDTLMFPWVASIWRGTGLHPSGPAEQEVRRTISATPKTPITILIEEGDDSPPSDPPETEREKKIREKVAELEVAIKGKVKEKDEEDLVFFPEGKFPEDFKWKLDKFDGSRDPRAHLKIFATFGRSWGPFENQMGQAFLYSLAGSVLRWLTQLDHTQTQSWASMVQVFMKQYLYNTEMDITRRELETLRQELNEKFLNFIMRFREKATKMWNHPIEEEQVEILLENLYDEYHEKIYYQHIKTFDALITIGKKIEDKIFKEKQAQGVTQETTGTYFGRKYSRAKGGNAIGRSHQAAEVQVVTAGTTPHVIQAELELPKRTFNFGGMTPTLLFTKLKKEGMINSVPPRHVDLNNPSTWYKSNLYCYYNDQKGHHTDRCIFLKHAIPDLIDKGKIKLQAKQ
ncbi:uncharacterized protein LOC122650946 [Telopea speciosissima]|uniref:uncharacterized protein LOC122650946 n=1 Tax=Telopea speciosissima TaxID=54955 RepID=UPI001CC69235|nr:uncharacterized protein LOC122650946 [Telopea speciosissima]